MTVVVVLGALAGLGVVGLWRGLRGRVPSLAAVASLVEGPGDVDHLTGRRRTAPGRLASLRSELGHWLVGRGDRAGAVADRAGPRALRPWALAADLAVTGQTADHLATGVLVGAGVGALAPPVLWAVAAGVGVGVPPGVAVLLAVVAVPVGVVLPFTSLSARAATCRRRVRAVLGTFVDLVVLGLAGGVGVEGALAAATEVSDDWVVRRLDRALAAARAAGESPWAALGRLGAEIDVAELVELSATLQLAGTEGTRIRQSLSARAVSLRRHEQADAESSANATTERLFLPGALLLLGFLLFVGYPAFTRIIGGF